MTFIRAVLAAVLLPCHGAAIAADVTLSSRDGSIEMTGPILAFDGEFYRIDSEYGPLTVDGSGVICRGEACPEPEAFVPELRLAGARTMGDILLPALVENFAIRNGYVLRREEEGSGTVRFDLEDRRSQTTVARFRFQLSDSAEGFADLLAGSADFVLSRREVTLNEALLARDAGLGDLTSARLAHIVGLDGLVALVSPSNGRRRISTEDLRRILAGDIDDWASIDGNAGPIRLHLLDSAMGLEDLAADRLSFRSSGLAEVTRHSSARALADAVADDPAALGLGLFSAMEGAQSLDLVGPCGTPAVVSDVTLKTEDYPLTAPLFVYVPARRLPKIGRDFLTFLSSQAAQPVVQRAHFVDQAPEPIPLDAQGLRLASAISRAGGDVQLGDLKRMVAALQGRERLTITFRFEGGASEPDAQSRSNIELLADALERGLFDGRRLIFIGFSDGQGPAALNQRLSLSRAQAIRDAVAATTDAAAIQTVTLDVAAFGEAMPMACDDVAWGRKINRRVEVWLD